MPQPPAICTIAILAVTALASFQGFRNPAFVEWFNPLFLPTGNPLHRWHDWLSEARSRRAQSQKFSDDQELDRLLDKISKAGMDSLSAAE